ncbi:TlpA disulfide reductase family protein [Virgibacillus sp. LDC-1]|uniref:TlpA disulfide reductase family protein n=1 Tax=Virgibacillus sp. LDC-1 TaxID=3039856 RepID=UPI0024DEFABD|nr:TlpA disulfide reductase family protein [Virgibacillus sp. LDC-1]
MKKTILIVVIVGMFAWAVYDFTMDNRKSASENETTEQEEKPSADQAVTKDQETEKPKVGLEKGDIAPDFELKTLDGESVKLSDFRGKRVMLNFWATWCPPCRAEMPDMQKFHENKDVVILAVNLTDTESSRQDVPDFTKDFGLTFRILMDEDLSVSTTYQIQPIPTSFLIDSKGIIHNKAFGALNYELMVQEFEKMK